MSEELRGIQFPIRQRRVEHYSPNNGVIVDYSWVGHDAAAARLYANSLFAAGCEYEYSFENGRHEIHAIDTSAEVPTDNWEMGVNEEVITSLRNPRNIAAIPSATLESIAAAALKGGDDLETLYAALTGAPKRLVGRIINDSGTYYHAQYVLRHTTNVSDRWGGNISDENINCIYTTAQLLSETQDSSLWQKILPGRLATKILALLAPAAEANYLWGWLKSASPESTAANNRVNIVTEYKLFQWSTDEYGTAVL